MACTSQSSPVARQASRAGGRSGHGRRFRRGAAVPEAVVQPESRPATCGVPGSHARARFSRTSTPIRMCTSGSATGSAERRSNPACGNATRNTPSIIPSGRADAKRIPVSTRRRRWRLRPSSTAPYPRPGGRSRSARFRAGRLGWSRAHGPVIEPLRGSEAVSGRPQGHFGASTGRRIAHNRRSPVSEGYG